MPPRPLTRELLLSAAIDLADAQGLSALTIRALAARVGAKPMAVYHHIPSKEAILDGIVDEVFTSITLPRPGLPWRAELAGRTRSAREVLLRHAWAVGLLESRRRPGPATLRHHDAVLGTLITDGFDVERAAHAYALLDSYLYGSVIQEASLPFAPEESQSVAAEMLTPSPDAPEPYPHLTRLAAELIGPDYDFGDEFEIGLEVVLDGLQRLRDEPHLTRDARPRT